MRRLICVAIATAVLCMPATGAESSPPGKLKRLWIASAAVLGAATFLDASSSIGKLERNPLMQGPNGQFSFRRGIAVKSGISGSMVLIQAMLNRNNGEHYKTSVIANFVSAGVYTGLAAYNSSIPRVAQVQAAPGSQQPTR
jgi:hypothetical protein